MHKTLIAVDIPSLRQLLFSDEVLNDLHSFTEVHWLDHQPLEDVIGDYDACITSWGSERFTPAVLSNAKKLRFIGHAAGTIVPFVDPSIYDCPITIVNANRPLSLATAEGAVAMMMHGAWDLHTYHAGLKNGIWSENNEQFTMGLYKQSIGLIGYGDISREVIRLLAPYEANILLCSSYCSPDEADALGVTLCSLEELLQRSRIVSLHNTLTASTRGLIGQAELAMMQDGSLLINTARGPIVDEEALIAGLANGRLKAVLDVFNTEPLPADHPLQQLPNACCLPHIAGFQGYWKRNLASYVARQLHRFVQGLPFEGQVCRDKFNRLSPK
ncbi:phosphoglycerate dehydrogenase-like enzyme [Paenibacillus cellulosilyticus]|uniref:Phosphoglycerate dehydrogenase-like enzyme n=2 Tax=Paenibacillus cellulosilyticus TaxID=375489 RepID=A0A2V2YEJ2_9BACL|nr:phosphoglycerate dehydrogenase-like enzyme [Paenibacillus cellulosilyticus]